MSYYTSVVTVTEEFLGPAAERFIRRQIEFHCEKTPESIDKKDVLKLRNSLGVALGLLISDKQIVRDAEMKFDNIAEQKETK